MATARQVKPPANVFKNNRRTGNGRCKDLIFWQDAVELVLALLGRCSLSMPRVAKTRNSHYKPC
jgi:hypothetical protein